MKFIDFDSLERFDEYYGGRAGSKYPVVYNGEVWILKFPKSTRDLARPQISYTTSPVSEYVGSHIYDLLGMPVHETVLGCRDGKVVVGCKDFTFSGTQKTADIIHFHQLKNTHMASDVESYSGDGADTLINEVLDTIVGERKLKNTEGIMERFWDMFVVDAFIGNNDRNNGNWGLLIQRADRSTTIAPVFDNGNAFFNKKSVETMLKSLHSEQTFEMDAYKNTQCVYKYVNVQGQEHRIKPFHMIETLSSGANAEIYNSAIDIRGLLGDALLRFEEHFDMNKIISMIGDIPSSASNLVVMPEEQKNYYAKILQTRYEKALLPAIQKVKERQNKEEYNK